MGAVGRLKDGASAEQARAELDAGFQAYMSEIGMKGSRHFNGIALIPAAKGSDGLRQRFATVEIELQGCVALFRAV